MHMELRELSGLFLLLLFPPRGEGEMLVYRQVHMEVRTGCLSPSILPALLL